MQNISKIEKQAMLSRCRMLRTMPLDGAFSAADNAVMQDLLDTLEAELAKDWPERKVIMACAHYSLQIIDKTRGAAIRMDMRQTSVILN